MTNNQTVPDMLTKQIEEKVAHHIATKKQISKNTNIHYNESLTFGQKIADKVASFGGSWTFIIIFASILVAWIVLNTFILAHLGKEFDPYPYILLNLVLSMMASMQAPIIMMSQNRQSARDRFVAEHDYEINLKAELEILQLQDKIDHMKNNHLNDIINSQFKQIEILNQIVQNTTKKPK